MHQQSREQSSWLLEGAEKDRQSVTSDWQPVTLQLIDGVVIHETRSVPKRNGLVTELFRADWSESPAAAGHVFVARMNPGGISAWHAHADAIDRLSVIAGAMTLVLYDARQGSPTFGRLNELQLNAARPLTVIVPPRVWHGVRNSGGVESLLVNMADRPYRYEEPDHWRVPLDSPEVPYRWEVGATAAQAI